ncbi:MAG: hypothetical protein ACYC99_16190 [Candidatus Geothermincolia bacterium]
MISCIRPSATGAVCAASLFAIRLRPFRTRFSVVVLLLLAVLYIGLAVLIGLWAGKVANGKGRDFGVFMAIGLVVSLCGLIPGLVVVVIAYALEPPQAGPRTRTIAATPPSGPGQPPPATHQVPPPPPPGPPTPPPATGQGSAGKVSPSRDGGFEYTPPPPSTPPKR